MEDAGEEWNEMEERFPEYDNLDIEDLNEHLEALIRRLLSDDDPLITEKITYINTLLNDSVTSDVMVQIDKYVQDRSGKVRG